MFVCLFCFFFLSPGNFLGNQTGIRKFKKKSGGTYFGAGVEDLSNTKHERRGGAVIVCALLWHGAAGTWNRTTSRIWALRSSNRLVLELEASALMVQKFEYLVTSLPVRDSAGFVDRIGDFFFFFKWRENRITIIIFEKKFEEEIE